MEISLLLSATQVSPTDFSHHLSQTKALFTTSLPSIEQLSPPKPMGFPTTLSSSSLLSETPSPSPPPPAPPLSHPSQASVAAPQTIPAGAQFFLEESPANSLERLPPFSRLTTRLLSPPTHAPSGVEEGRVEKKTVKPFKCSYEGCEATFGQKGSLTRHIRSRHQKLRPHSCDLCQKSFSALWTLRVHQRNVHFKSKPHKCHLCDKSFGELFNKSKHIAIVHEGKRPFSCPICSRAFGYKGDMRKHVLELHEQSGRPFQCIIPSCGVKFARKRYLRRHENLSHKGHPLLAARELPSSPQGSNYNTNVLESTARAGQAMYVPSAISGIGKDVVSASPTESSNSAFVPTPKYHL